MGTHDWELLSITGVMDVIEQAAEKVARHYELDAEDLYQEAILLVTDLHTNLPEVVHDLGLLQYRLEQDLRNKTEREVRNRARHTSYELRYSPGDEDGEFAPRPARITIRQEVGGYTRELVESLIPAVWDEAYCYGMRVENAPDGDMPRGATNKATGNTLAAHIADIKRGWDKAPLTIEERRALFLGYAMDWTQEEIAFNQDCTQQTISNRLYRGVGKVMAELNGDQILKANLMQQSTDEALDEWMAELGIPVAA